MSTIARNNTQYSYDKWGYQEGETIFRGKKTVVTVVFHKDNPAVRLVRKGLRLNEMRDDNLRDEVENIIGARSYHVIELLNHFRGQNFYFLVMPYANMGNLGEYITLMNNKYRGRGDVGKQAYHEYGIQRAFLIQWISCLAATIAYLHSQDIRHCDIKPENILIHNNRVLVADFGIAFHSPEVTEVGLTFTVGTKRYLPPEAHIVYEGGIRMFRSGFKGDIWSLGCVFYEMLWAMSLLTTGKLTQGFPNIHKTSVDDCEDQDDEDGITTAFLLGSPVWIIRDYASTKTKHGGLVDRLLRWEDDEENLELLEFEYRFNNIRGNLGKFVWVHMLSLNQEYRADAKAVLDHIATEINRMIHEVRVEIDGHFYDGKKQYQSLKEVVEIWHGANVLNCCVVQRSIHVMSQLDRP